MPLNFLIAFIVLICLIALIALSPINFCLDCLEQGCGPASTFGATVGCLFQIEKSLM
jgi:hypothetical protein